MILRIQFPYIQELLVVIRETENDELTSVMEELIETYSDQIGDVAVSLCASLVSKSPQRGKDSALPYMLYSFDVVNEMYKML